MKRYTSIAAVARHDAFGCLQTRWLGYSRGDGRERHCTGFTEGEHFARPFTSLFRCAIDDATRIDRSRRATSGTMLGCVVTRWLGYSRADGRDADTGLFFLAYTFSHVTRSKHVGGAGRPRICNIHMILQ